jgi:hypothetical protein
MTLTIDLDNGKQAIVSSDPRSKGVWLQLHANRGSLGIELSKRQAIELNLAIVSAIREGR